MEHTFPRHVYYSKFRNMNLILSILMFVLALFLLASQYTNYFLGFVLLLNSTIMYSLATLRIAVSPNGISYHNMGLYSIYSTWENVDRVALVDFRALGTQRCIILKKGQSLGWWTDLAWAIPRDKRGYFIPILDGKNWNRFDELKKEIKTYIPDVTGLD